MRGDCRIRLIWRHFVIEHVSSHQINLAPQIGSVIPDNPIDRPAIHGDVPISVSGIVVQGTPRKQKGGIDDRKKDFS